MKSFFLISALLVIIALSITGANSTYTEFKVSGGQCDSTLVMALESCVANCGALININATKSSTANTFTASLYRPPAPNVGVTNLCTSLIFSQNFTCVDGTATVTLGMSSVTITCIDPSTSTPSPTASTTNGTTTSTPSPTPSTTTDSTTSSSPSPTPTQSTTTGGSTTTSSSSTTTASPTTTTTTGGSKSEDGSNASGSLKLIASSLFITLTIATLLF